MGNPVVTGTCPVSTDPIEDNVRDGVTYKIDDIDYEGNLVVPSANDLRDGVGAGTSGTEVTGNIQLAPADKIVVGTGNGSNGTEIAGNVILPDEEEVESGVGFGANGTEFTGSLVGIGSGSVTADDTTPTTEQLVTFTPSWTGITPALWTLDFGDGTISSTTGATITHTYPTTGTYTVKLIAGSAITGIPLNTQTDYVTVSAATQLYAADFTGANWLSSTNAVFNVGDEDFSFGCWVYLDATGTKGIMSKYRTSGNQRAYGLYCTAASPFFLVSANGSTFSQTPSTTAITISTWTFIVCVHDSVANLIKLSLNGAAFVTNAHTAGAYGASTAPLIFGELDGGSFLDGRVDSAFFYKKALTIAQVQTLYNSGNGTAYTSMDTVSLTEYWKMNVASGSRIGFHGGYNLTDNNSVGRATGKVLD